MTLGEPGQWVSRARLRAMQVPGSADRGVQLAEVLWQQDQLAEALTWARWAVRARPGRSSPSPLAWLALGNVLLDHGRLAEAEFAYRLADPLRIDPVVLANRAQVALARGDFTAAWPLAESRLLRKNPPEGVIPGPWWRGWPQVNQLTVWSEQGFGDVLQHLRWLPLVLETGRSVRLLVDLPLRSLLELGLGWMGSGLSIELRSEGRSLLEGCHGSLLSLPWLLGQGSEGSLCAAYPYIRLPQPPADPTAGRQAVPRVGILWGAGRYLDDPICARNYWRKSLLGSPLRELLCALEQRSLRLVKLQVGPDRELPEQSGIAWDEVLDPDADFLGLAQALQRLDLLLCVDTAGAHLAGAMGVPVWLLLPWAAECRWQRDRSDTPWYPSLTLWRQPRHGDWRGLISELLPALDQWVSSWNKVS